MMVVSFSRRHAIGATPGAGCICWSARPGIRTGNCSFNFDSIGREAMFWLFSAFVESSNVVTKSSKEFVGWLLVV